MIQSIKDVPIRFFIIDNSGSMIINDGNKVGTQGTRKSFVRCSRWEELVQSIHFHSGLANAAGAVTEFRLLNNADPIMIGENDDGGMAHRTFLTFLKKSRPNESTPLCRYFHFTSYTIHNIFYHNPPAVLFLLC